MGVEGEVLEEADADVHLPGRKHPNDDRYDELFVQVLREQGVDLIGQELSPLDVCF